MNSFRQIFFFTVIIILYSNKALDLRKKVFLKPQDIFLNIPTVIVVMTTLDQDHLALKA